MRCANWMHRRETTEPSADVGWLSDHLMYLRFWRARTSTMLDFFMHISVCNVCCHEFHYWDRQFAFIESLFVAMKIFKCWLTDLLYCWWPSVHYYLHWRLRDRGQWNIFTVKHMPPFCDRWILSARGTDKCRADCPPPFPLVCQWNQWEHVVFLTLIWLVQNWQSGCCHLITAGFLLSFTVCLSVCVFPPSPLLWPLHPRLHPQTSLIKKQQSLIMKAVGHPDKISPSFSLSDSSMRKEGEQ